MSDNYPPGAKNDPNAPYNEIDYGTKKCTDCNGLGIIPNSYPDQNCDTCNGTGEIDKTKEDHYDKYLSAMEEKADAKREEQ